MLVLLLMLCCPLTISAAKSYEGYKLVSVIPENADQLHHLVKLEEDSGVLFWTGIRLHETVDIVVSPHEFIELTDSLRQHQMEPIVKIDNIQRELDAAAADHDKRVLERKGGEFTVDVYHTLDEINDWLKSLPASSDLVTLDSIGKSYEGRDIYYVTITSGTPGSKPVHWIDCNIHACEWIAGSSCIWYINELVTKYGKDEEITRLVDTYDWMILPILNVDGYIWSFGDDRLWRKTRRPNPGSECIGTDPNRNYDNHFGGEGSSNDPCSWIYHGPEPFSESEIAAHRDIVLSVADRLMTFYTMHTAGQVWMSPNSWTTELPHDYALMEAAMSAGVGAIEATHNADWRYGSSANSYYVASGVTEDWAYYATNCTHTYIVEMRSKESMVLPEDQIVPNAEETWNGIVAALKVIENQ